MCWRPSACCRASRRPWRVRIDGQLHPGVTAKDIILAMIAKIGVGGGTGYVFEYMGEAIRALSHGRAHDDLQYVDRGRRARRADRARRDHLRVSGRPAVRAQGAAWDQAVAALARSCRPTKARPSSKVVTLDANALDADDHLRHQSRHGHADHQPHPRPRATCQRSRASASRSTRRCATWICSRASRCWATRSTWSSSAAAPTRASRDLRAGGAA